MGELFGLNGNFVVLAILASILVLFFIIILLSVKLSSLRKRYTQMMNGSSSDNMEQLLIEMQQAINDQKAESAMTSAQVDTIRQSLTKMKSKVAIHRYNAFNDGGSNLSFTIAILDDYQDGVVLTGIHSREQMYLYAKPIQNGQSTYTLSPEEKEAINQSVKPS
ncbi:DUF4446 family protein [Paenibacillus sp. CGMCC 1.16610]|uniref:DUF4446 family protein n=1 Tax=Paenibacillus anseongense TaxID=2682845 RepID=A0ABW9UI13_9BACL|nr:MULTISPECIES: DUF4446 family protein [Paenibacillus]MBA2939384.1 DUF4446 family protein [Paenibacillus sp. CGMCC 1.16610]MVQ39829.1 DUF4446 family protein [Paenibacillus anseongense]